MDLNKRISFKFKECFGEKLKKLLITKESVKIITNDDKVYEFEKDLRTLVEINKMNNKSFIESKILSELCFKGIIDFKDGLLFVIARTEDGKVYCWGNNILGVFGNGADTYKTFKPELNVNLSDKYIIDISCGSYHSLALTNYGEVYAWGLNLCGQIGIGSEEVQLIPKKVNGFNDEKVVMISCGYNHSLALTESGRVFFWGSNKKGQIINFENISKVEKPSVVILSNEIRIKKISCGYEHSLLLSCGGDIYWFGWNGIEEQNTPKKLTIDENKFIDIASHHKYNILVALSVNNVYYVWGECGEEIIKEPKETDFKSFEDVFDHFFGITHKTIDRMIDFKYKIIKNGKYSKDFIEKDKLGEGYYGEVFRAFDLYWKNDYAIKKMKFTIDKEMDLFKELEIFTIFNSGPLSLNLLKAMDIWLENTENNDKSTESLTLFTEMELFDTTLEQVIKELQNDINLYINSTLTELGYYMASQLIIEILEGVYCLHKDEPQILHMDLHTGNILLKKFCQGLRLKISDYGLAKICEFAQKSNQVLAAKNTWGLSRSCSKSLNEFKSGSYNTKNDIYGLRMIIEELFSIDKYRLMKCIF
jgi:alpha-tubulin suppressor-like RCC1 family protein